MATDRRTNFLFAALAAALAVSLLSSCAKRWDGDAPEPSPAGEGGYEWGGDLTALDEFLSSLPTMNLTEKEDLSLDKVLVDGTRIRLVDFIQAYDPDFLKAGWVGKFVGLDMAPSHNEEAVREACGGTDGLDGVENLRELIVDELILSAMYFLKDADGVACNQEVRDGIRETDTLHRDAIKTELRGKCKVKTSFSKGKLNADQLEAAWNAKTTHDATDSALYGQDKAKIEALYSKWVNGEVDADGKVLFGGLNRYYNEHYRGPNHDGKHRQQGLWYKWNGKTWNAFSLMDTTSSGGMNDHIAPYYGLDCSGFVCAAMKKAGFVFKTEKGRTIDGIGSQAFCEVDNYLKPTLDVFRDKMARRTGFPDDVARKLVFTGGLVERGKLMQVAKPGDFVVWRGENRHVGMVALGGRLYQCNGSGYPQRDMGTAGPRSLDGKSATTAKTLGNKFGIVRLTVDSGIKRLRIGIRCGDVSEGAVPVGDCQYITQFEIALEGGGERTITASGKDSGSGRPCVVFCSFSYNEGTKRFNASVTKQYDLSRKDDDPPSDGETDLSNPYWRLARRDFYNVVLSGEKMSVPATSLVYVDGKNVCANVMDIEEVKEEFALPSATQTRSAAVGGRPALSDIRCVGCRDMR